MKTIIYLFVILTLPTQLLSQVFNIKSVNTPGDIAITSIEHRCFGMVNGVDTTLGYFSALPLDQVWPIKLSASIANIGPNDQSNVVLSAEIVNESGTIVYAASENGGNILAGGSLHINLADNFLPADVGTYTLTMSVMQDEGDYDITNNEVIRQIIEINQNGVIDRHFDLNSSIEIPTGNPATSMACIQFAIPSSEKIKSLSVYLDTVIQAQTFFTAYLFKYTGAMPEVVAVSEPIEVTTSMSHSWIEITFPEVEPGSLNLVQNFRYLVGVEAYNVNGVAFISADNADFHDFDDETYFSGYSPIPERMPAIRINLKTLIHAEIITIDQHIHIFPNPVSDILHIQNTYEVKFLVLNDLSGKIIRVIDQPTSNQDIHFIRLPNGFYILKIVNQDNSFKEFIIIKN